MTVMVAQGLGSWFRGSWKCSTAMLQLFFFYNGLLLASGTLNPHAEPLHPLTMKVFYL